MKEHGKESGSVTVRSALEREKTKMRERQRRSITTNIFHGLRKHGGYRLSPRADINEVLRHLAQEAGWIIEPDGTTFRSPTFSNGSNIACPMCGVERKSALPTPSSSYLGGGDCSTTASPHRDSAVDNISSGEIPAGSTMASNEGLVAMYMCGGAPPNGGGALELNTADI